MSFTIPDKGEGASNVQSILFQEDIDVLVAGIAGIDYVFTGCAVSPNALLVLNVEAGTVVSNRTVFNIAAATPSVGTANATNPRIDLVVVDSAGAVAVRAGTPAAVPKPPARSANDVVLAQIFVAANDTDIGATEIVDKRVVQPGVGFSLGADATANATTTGVKIDGLDLRLEPGTYEFEYSIISQAAATNTGIKFGVNFTGTQTALVANWRFQESTTAAGTGAHSQNSGTGGKLITGSSTRAVSTTAPNLGPSISVDAVNANMASYLKGKIVVTVAGNLELWHGSEVATSTQVMAGTSLTVRRVA